jgi:hypothetical protein
MYEMKGAWSCQDRRLSPDLAWFTCCFSGIHTASTESG